VPTVSCVSLIGSDCLRQSRCMVKTCQQGGREEERLGAQKEGMSPNFHRPGSQEVTKDSGGQTPGTLAF
jgi:hypothetical protein